MGGTLDVATSRPTEENSERPEKLPTTKEMEMGIPLTAEELAETTGGGGEILSLLLQK